MNKNRLPAALVMAMVAAHAAAGNIDLAVSTGNPALVDSPEELYSPLLTLLSTTQKNYGWASKNIWGTGGINYAPGQNSQIFNILDPGKVWPIAIGSAKGTNLAVAGNENIGRFVAWGSHLIDKVQTGNLGSPYNSVVDNTLAFVMKTTPVNLPAARNVAIAFMSGSEMTNTRNWIAARFPQWTVTLCTDPSTLSLCLSGQSLIIAGDSVNDALGAAAAQTLMGVVRNGTGLAYLHDRWSTNAFSNQLAQIMRVEMPYGGNWFGMDSAQWTNTTAMLAGDNAIKQMTRLVTHLQNRDFPVFDWSQCTTSVGTTNCNNVPGVSSEFLQGAGYLRSLLRQQDQNGKPLFAQTGYRLVKLFVLLGDKLRQQTVYPLDKQLSGNSAFFQAYLADYLTTYLRLTNPAANTGTFSTALPPTVTPGTRYASIVLNSTSRNISTGFYALPGTPVKMLRLDTLPSNVGLYLNNIRAGSTREWNTNGLARPKFLQSPVFPVSTTALTATSPYGGPVYLTVPPGTGTIKVQISGVAPYPYLTNIADATAVDAFRGALDASPFSWAGIKTGFVDINSRTSMLRSTINGAPYNGDLPKAMSDIWTYMIKGTYELAGFSGSGLYLPQTVKNRCTALNWDCANETIHAKPATQHITVDTVANCGSGCSGNPYDQDWPLSPLGWGESHEIGHNLQRSRLKIYAGKTTEVSNNIFPSFKAWQYYKTTGIKVDHCSRGNDRKMYTWLQEAHATADPRTAMYNRLWSQTGIYDNAFERLSFYLQMAYATNALTQLSSGWQIFTLMYLHERLFTDAIKDAAAWSANKDKLGFGTYAAAPVGIDGNDFMLVSFSFLTRRDQRPFFDAWGVSYSAAAAQQVASYGFAAITPVYYHSPDHCTALNVPAFPVDGVTVLP